MQRRRFVLTGSLALLGIIGTRLIIAAPEDADGLRSQGGPTLQEMLEKGLKCRRPAEFEYVELVVTRVKEGRLPPDLVNSTFLWARRKQPYPFPYFQRGLRKRAADQGIEFEEPEREESWWMRLKAKFFLTGLN